MQLFLHPLCRKTTGENTKYQDTKISSDPQSSPGTVVNLMSIDAFQVGELGSYLHDLFPTLPVQLILSTSLLYSVMGWSAFVSITLMVLLMPVNVIFATLFTKAYKMIMKNTEERIGLTNEVLETMKIIKVRPCLLR